VEFSVRYSGVIGKILPITDTLFEKKKRCIITVYFVKILKEAKSYTQYFEINNKVQVFMTPNNTFAFSYKLIGYCQRA
jgi:hypothetical protein